MRHTLPTAPQFYVTAPQSCPYLDNRVERKLFTTLVPETAQALNNTLSQQGFRRSQNVIYRPTCSQCNGCRSARVVAAEFAPSRSQRRVLKRNKGLKRVIKSPMATEEQFALFSSYLNSRHADGGMAGMDEFEFAAMIEETPVDTRVLEYRLDGDLVAVCLTDLLSDGVSMVYSFFRPDLYSQSIGTYMILDHINLAKEAGLAYVYLGYWVAGSPKMDYKSRFTPLETFVNGGWSRLEPESMAQHPDHPLNSDTVARQVAAIHLPKL